MEFRWGPSIHDEFGSLKVRLDGGNVFRCGEVYPTRPSRQDKWTYVLSFHIAPVAFVVEDRMFDTKREAKEALQAMATVLLIGGNHERDRTKEL